MPTTPYNLSEKLIGKCGIKKLIICRKLMEVKFRFYVGNKRVSVTAEKAKLS